MQVPESKTNETKKDRIPAIMFLFCMMVALGFFVTALVLRGQYVPV
jgi:hypothetical protein